MLRPGVHWDDVQLRCHEILVDGFLGLGIFRSPETTSGTCPIGLKINIGQLTRCVTWR